MIKVREFIRMKKGIHLHCCTLPINQAVDIFLAKEKPHLEDSIYHLRFAFLGNKMEPIKEVLRRKYKE